MGRAVRNPSLKESIMIGFGYRLYPSCYQLKTGQFKVKPFERACEP